MAATSKLTDKESALAMLEHASVAIAKTTTTYPGSRRMKNVRILGLRDETLLGCVTL